jgi:hypothetical protein
MPLLGGMLEKKPLNAFSPPADAPIPTTNGPFGGLAATDFLVRLGEYGFVFRALWGRFCRDLAFLFVVT